MPSTELARSLIDLARRYAAAKGSSFASTHSLLVAILATGKSSRLPRYDGDRLLPRSVLTATLSADHRAVDGAEAGRFLGTLKKTLENPATERA